MDWTKGYDSITIDKNAEIPDTLLAKEGDIDTRGINIFIRENGFEVDTSNLVVRMYAKLFTDDIFLMEAEEVDVTKGMYRVTYPQAILKTGEIEAEISLADTYSSYSTMPFIVDVKAGIISKVTIKKKLPVFEELLLIFEKELGRQAEFVSLKEEIKTLKERVDVLERGE